MSTSWSLRIAPVTVVVAIAGALLLTACGDSGDGGGSKTTASKSTTSTSTTGASTKTGTTTDGASKASRTSYALPNTRLFPEGMGYDPKANAFYAGSISDGTVVRGDVATGQVSTFLVAGGDGRKTTTGMRPNGKNELFVAGGAGGGLWVYSTPDATLVAKLKTGDAKSFTNDVDFTSDGTAYVTDSARPVLWRTTGKGSARKLVKFLDFTDTPFRYETGPNQFNADGIQVTDDDTYAIVSDLATGQLFRVGLQSKDVREVTIAGGKLTAPDGIKLDGHTLYVAENSKGAIAKLTLGKTWDTATLDGETTDPRFDFPTGVALPKDGKLLVLNSQLDKLGGGKPRTPFQVLVLDRP